MDHGYLDILESDLVSFNEGFNDYLTHGFDYDASNNLSSFENSEYVLTCDLKYQSVSSNSANILHLNCQELNSSLTQKL